MGARFGDGANDGRPLHPFQVAQLVFQTGESFRRHRDFLHLSSLSVPRRAEPRGESKINTPAPFFNGPTVRSISQR